MTKEKKFIVAITILAVSRITCGARQFEASKDRPCNAGSS